jgi:hypothetical protein
MNLISEKMEARIREHVHFVWVKTVVDKKLFFLKKYNTSSKRYAGYSDAFLGFAPLELACRFPIVPG